MWNQRPKLALGGWLASGFMRVMASSLAFIATCPLDDVFAQTNPAATAQPGAAPTFNPEQLDALLASIALYPDQLLTQFGVGPEYRQIVQGLIILTAVAIHSYFKRATSR